MQHGLGIGAEGVRPQIPGASRPRGSGTSTGTTSGTGSYGGGSGDAGPENASPEEQALYNRAVTLFMVALYDKKMLPKHLDFIKNAENPVDGVAEVASLLTMRVYTKALEGKPPVEIPGDILLKAGQDEIVPLVIEVAEAAGIAEFDQSQVDAAFYSAADKFTKAMRNVGSYTDDQRGADLQELDRMADSGEIEGLLQKIGAGVEEGDV